MKRILSKWCLLLTCFLAVGLVARADGFHTDVFTGTGTGATVPNIGTGISYHKITWTNSGTVSTCTIAVDTSADGVTWSAGGAITGQTCTSNGASAVVNVTANYVRANMTTLTGTNPSVAVTWDGYVNNPAGGAGTLLFGATTQNLNNSPATASGQCLVSTGSGPYAWVAGACSGSASTNWSALTNNAANVGNGSYLFGTGSGAASSGTGTITANQLQSGAGTPVTLSFSSPLTGQYFSVNTGGTGLALQSLPPLYAHDYGMVGRLYYTNNMSGTGAGTTITLTGSPNFGSGGAVVNDLIQVNGGALSAPVTAITPSFTASNGTLPNGTVLSVLESCLTSNGTYITGESAPSSSSTATAGSANESWSGTYTSCASAGGVSATGYRIYAGPAGAERQQPATQTLPVSGFSLVSGTYDYVLNNGVNPNLMYVGQSVTVSGLTGTNCSVGNQTGTLTAVSQGGFSIGGGSGSSTPTCTGGQVVANYCTLGTGPLASECAVAGSAYASGNYSIDGMLPVQNSAGYFMSEITAINSNTNVTIADTIPQTFSTIRGFWGANNATAESNWAAACQQGSTANNTASGCNFVLDGPGKPNAITGRYGALGAWNFPNVATAVLNTEISCRDGGSASMQQASGYASGITSIATDTPPCALVPFGRNWAVTVGTYSTLSQAFELNHVSVMDAGAGNSGTPSFGVAAGGVWGISLGSFTALNFSANGFSGGTGIQLEGGAATSQSSTIDKFDCLLTYRCVRLLNSAVDTVVTKGEWSGIGSATGTSVTNTSATLGVGGIGVELNNKSNTFRISQTDIQNFGTPVYAYNSQNVNVTDIRVEEVGQSHLTNSSVFVLDGPSSGSVAGPWSLISPGIASGFQKCFTITANVTQPGNANVDCPSGVPANILNNTGSTPLTTFNGADPGNSPAQVNVPLISSTGQIAGPFNAPTITGLTFGASSIALSGTAPGSGQCLYYSGSAIGGTPCGGAPGGSPGAVQGNISSAFAAIPNFTFNTSTGALTTTSSLTLDYANFPTDASHTCAANDVFFSATGIPVAGVGAGDCERIGFPPVYVSATSSPLTDPGGQNNNNYNNTGGALTVTLPDGILSDGGSKPVSQIQRCYTNPNGATGVITVNAMSSPLNTIYLYGTSEGTSLVSGGALGDEACFISLGSHKWYATIVSGLWNGIGPPGGTGAPGGSPTDIQYQVNGTTFGGASNFTYTSATGVVTLNQLANGNQTLYGTRFTDTSPTGNFIDFQNAAASSDLFKVDASGNVTMGTISFLGNLYIGSTPATTGSWLGINSGTTANNPGYMKQCQGTGQTTCSYLFGSQTVAGLYGVSSTTPAGDVAAGTALAANPLSAADQAIGSGSGTQYGSTGVYTPAALTLPSCSTGSSALTYSTSTHTFGCNSISAGAPSLDQVTGSAAQATATETAAGHNVTEAGVETTALVVPFVFTNANSTNNNSSGALAIGLTGTSTGATNLYLVQPSAAGNFIQACGGTSSITNGTVVCGTTEASIAANGAATFAGTVTSGQLINSVGMESNTATGSIKVASGNDTATATTAGLLTLRGHDVLSGSTANSKGGNVLVRGGNDAGSIASALAGAVEVMAGAATGATQGTQGNTVIGTTYIKGTTSTQWKIQQITATNTVQDATGSAVAGIVGIAEVVNTNSDQVVFDGQSFVITTGTATVGHNICMSSTAGEGVDSSTGCAVGTKIGVVLDVTGAHTLADGTTATATSTQPWIQVGLN